MTCAATEPWMLAARTADDLPERARRHLAQCQRCATRFDRLLQVDVAAAQLAPGSNPEGRARLAARLAETPQRRPAAKPQQAQPAPARQNRLRTAARWAAALAAAVLLILAGWWAGRSGSHAPVVKAPEHPQPAAPEVPPTPLPAPAVVPARSLVAKVAHHSAGVAADPSPEAQAESLYRIAADVRADALKDAAAGEVGSLPRLVALHNRVLTLGVARQARRIPAAQRGAATAKMVEGLNHSAEEVAAAAGLLPPAVGDALRPLVQACREAGAAIQRGESPAVGDWPAAPTQLELLAAHTVRLSDFDDPLARADESVHLAAVMSQVIAVLAVAGLPDDAAHVGEALDAVLEAGVAANLDRVEAADAAGKRRDEVAKVRERAGRATEVLERNLAKVPPAARAGLERAMAASGRGKGSGKGPGKGNGPPWKKGEGEHPGKRGGTPPGWQKKPRRAPVRNRRAAG